MSGQARLGQPFTRAIGSSKPPALTGQPRCAGRRRNSPSRSSTMATGRNCTRESIGADRIEVERAAPAARDCGAWGRSAALGRAARAPGRQRDSEQAPAHSPAITRGCQPPGGRSTPQRTRRRTAARLETSAPTARRGQAATSSEARAGAEQGCELLRSAAVGDPARSGPSGSGATPRNRCLPSTHALCGDNRAVFQPELSRELPVGIVDAPGNTKRTRSECHAFGVFDHQQLGRAVGLLSNDDQGCGGDGLVGHQRTEARPLQRKAAGVSRGGSFNGQP